MFRKFLNWKRNIKPINWNGLYILYDPSTPYEDLWKEISSLIISDQSFSFVKDIKNSNFGIDKNQYGQDIIFEKKDSATNEYSLSEYLGFSYKNKTKTYDKRLILSLKNKTLSRDLINKLLSNKGIYFAILYNPYFKSWENRKIKDMYHYSAGLKEKFNADLGVKTIDITNRPGRYYNSSKLSFMGGSEYWFSQELLTIEKLKAISDIEINVIESNNVTHVKLFDLPRYWENASQKKIAQIRKLLEIDTKSNK